MTAYPTTEWTLQQLREALADNHPHRFVIHDRDSIFSKRLDQAVTDLGVRVLRTPVRAPMANSVCERFDGTLRFGEVTGARNRRIGQLSLTLLW